MKIEKPDVGLILMAKEDAFQLSEAVLDLAPYSDEADDLDYAKYRVKELLKSGYIFVNRVVPESGTVPSSEPLDMKTSEHVLETPENWQPKDELRETHYTLTLTETGQSKFLEIIGTPGYDPNATN